MAAPDPSELERLGLYDPAAPDAGEQLALLRRLIELGATPEGLVEAKDNGRLAQASADLALRPGAGTLDDAAVAAHAGVEPALARRLTRAAGLPNLLPGTTPFTEEDADMLTTFADACEVYGEEVATQLVRVIGTAMARVAEAAGSAFLNVEGDLTAAGSDELALARATLRAVGLLPGTVRAMEVLLRRHLTAFIGVAMGLRDEPVVDLAVAFADLVGFTAFSQQLSPAELSRAVARFEAEASDTIAGEGGRLVKLIGDEAMVVTAEAETACRVALALVGRFADHEVLPPVRVGLATGPVLPQDGDYFGQPVNLASRLATLARPGTVLVGAGIKQAVAANPAYHLRPVGRRRLKGFDAPVPTWALRPATGRGT